MNFYFEGLKNTNTITTNNFIWLSIIAKYQGRRQNFGSEGGGHVQQKITQQKTFENFWEIYIKFAQKFKKFPKFFSKIQNKFRKFEKIFY